MSSVQLRKTHLARTRHTIVFNDANHHVFVDGEDVGAFAAQLSAAALTVLGTYKPHAAGRIHFPNMVMADGSTMDLSEMEDMPTFQTASEVTSADAGHALSFATNATVAVKLGARADSISSSVPVIGWAAEAAPDNLATLTFVPGDENARYRLEKRADGVYAATGFAIFLR